MASLAFSAIGSSIGGSLLGGVLGNTIGASLGKAAGAYLGNRVDQMLFGSDMEPTKSDPREKLRFTNSYIGKSVPQVYGRSRLAGQIIWAKQIIAKANKETGYDYFSSFAVALCEGEVHRIGRIWANNQIVNMDTSTYRFYSGSNRQEQDPLILDDLGEYRTPAFRGVCYIVFDNLDLAPFGNSIPNFEFEVFRHSKNKAHLEMKDHVTAVSIIPGTGEYALESEKVEIDQGYGEGSVVNVHRAGSLTDFDHAIEQLQTDSPNVQSSSLVVSWFGDDLRCAHCQIMPKVEQVDYDANLPWSVNGISREEASVVSRLEGNSVYGGTPSDSSVVNAIQKLKDADIEVMFYPFVLMDIPGDNLLQDPWKTIGFQEANPWRGRITTSKAPGIASSTDGTENAQSEIDAFFGNASVADFSSSAGNISYNGEQIWGYRRFILHYAHLCALAGGVAEFIIGSEFVGLSTVRDHQNKFPFVQHLIDLAADVRVVLGSGTKISYAADWSEYFGYHPQQEPGAAYFHLDDLWSDSNIDFVGIDNYMPISDWRHGADHTDLAFGSIYNIDYLKSNILGGEGYDWFYASQEDRDNQIRTPITDGRGEPWVWRNKDIQNWWSQPHYNRPNGVRESTPTNWKPYSKPIRFTEYGAAAIDLSTNQPNKFLDLHSSESSLPYYSDASQDSYIQSCYTRAFNEFWNDKNNNPISPIDGRQMVESDKSYCWTWDARPWPEFPTRTDVWADGAVFAKGHWLSSRVNSVSLANVIFEICFQAGFRDIDVSKLYGFVDGIMFAGDETAREKIETLMRAYQFDTFTRDGVITFKSRDFVNYRVVDEELFVSTGDGKTVTTNFANPNKRSGRFELHYIDGQGGYLPATVQSYVAERNSDDRIMFNLPVVLSQQTAKDLLEYYVWQSRQSEEKIHFNIAKIGRPYNVGDIINLPESKGRKLFRIDRIMESLFLEIEATCLEAYELKSTEAVEEYKQVTLSQPRSVYAQYLDIPVGTNNGLHVAFGASPWVGDVSVVETHDYSTQNLLSVPYSSTIGRLESEMPLGIASRLQPVTAWVKLTSGEMINHGGVHDNLSNACLAIGPDPNGKWELLGYKEIEPMGDKTYLIRGLYRGAYGTEDIINTWPAGTNVIVLDERINFISSEQLSDSDQHNIAYGPQMDLSFWQDMTIDNPDAYSKPIAPCRINAVRNENGILVSFLPRLRMDKDNWRNGLQTDVDDQVFELDVYADSQKIFSYIGAETRHEFEYSGNEIEVQVRSIINSNFKSQFVKEIMNV